MKPLAVIGVGNYLLGDEGVGIHAVQRLSQELKRDDCEFIDAGVPSLSLLHMIENRRMVIIIDSADFGGVPGEVKVFRPEDVFSQKEMKFSLHSSDLLSTLELGKKIDSTMPTVYIIGVQPASLKEGTNLSPAVAGAMDKIISLCAELLR